MSSRSLSLLVIVLSPARSCGRVCASADLSIPSPAGPADGPRSLPPTGAGSNARSDTPIRVTGSCSASVVSARLSGAARFPGKRSRTRGADQNVGTTKRRPAEILPGGASRLGVHTVAFPANAFRHRANLLLLRCRSADREGLVSCASPREPLRGGPPGADRVCTGLASPLSCCVAARQSPADRLRSRARLSARPVHGG